MSRTAIELITGVPGVIALLWLAAMLIKDRTLKWTVASTAVFAAGWLLSLPTALSNITGNVAQAVDSNNQNYLVYTAGWYSRVTHFSNYALIAGGVVIVMLQIRHKTVAFEPAAFFAVGIVLFGIIADDQSGQGVLPKAKVTLLVLLIAAGFLNRRGALLGGAVFGISLAAVSGITTLLHYDAAVTDCGITKCGPLKVLWNGALANENSLGLSLAVAIPLVWLSVKWTRTRWVFCLYLLGMVYITGSRTSQLGAIVAVLACAFQGRLLVTVDAVRTFALRALAVAGVAAGVYLPFTTNDPSKYTGRAGLWITARHLVSPVWYVGRGGLYWGTYATTQIGTATAYSVHNQWLDILFDAGVPGLVLFTLLVGCIAYRPGGLLLIIPMIWLGITERVWGLSYADAFSWVLPCIIMEVGAQRVDADIAPIPEPEEDQRLRMPRGSWMGQKPRKKPKPSRRRVEPQRRPHTPAPEPVRTLAVVGPPRQRFSAKPTSPRRSKRR